MNILETIVHITDILSNLSVLGGIFFWISKKFHEKRDQDIHYLMKEINNMMHFSEQCKNELEQAIKNKLTIEDWIRETRRYTSHTSWNNFVNIRHQLNEPNDKKVKKILEHGDKIRRVIFDGRKKLKEDRQAVITKNHQDIFIIQATKVAETEFSKIIHKESNSSTSSQQ